jgi:hypothetical protein
LEKITKNKKKIKFVFVELRGERKVKESNQYSRGKQDLERREKWVRVCTADAGLGAVTELDYKYKFNLETHRSFSFKYYCIVQ